MAGEERARATAAATASKENGPGTALVATRGKCAIRRSSAVQQATMCAGLEFCEL
jgi:hypothetical protein